MSFALNVEALRRHQGAAFIDLDLFSQEESEPLSLTSELPDSDVLLFWGLPTQNMPSLRAWIDDKEGRRLIFVAPSVANLRAFLEGEDTVVWLQDCRMRFCCMETPLQEECIATEVAWRVALRRWHLFHLLPHGECFERRMKECHTAAELLLSDAADWGCGIVANLMANVAPCKNGLSLRNAFQGIPAICCGAGPSLAKQSALLRDVGDRALIFAGGQALPLLHAEGIVPHFGGAIDPRAPVELFREALFWQTPFLLQRRMHQKNFALLQGDRVLFPDSHFQFEAHLSGFETLFDGGWTVGTFLLRCAAWMGCDPIIWVGMDLACPGGQKYAYAQEAPFAPEQKDFWMAARWIEGAAAALPERRWINATEGGVALQSPVVTASFAEVLSTLRDSWDLVGSVHQMMQLSSEMPAFQQRLTEWPDELKQASALVHRVLLEPIWTLFRPLLEREAEVDLLPLPLEEKLRLHRTLLFQTILQEHLCSATN